MIRHLQLRQRPPDWEGTLTEGRKGSEGMKNEAQRRRPTRYTSVIRAISASTALDFEGKDFAWLALDGDFERAATDLAVGCEAL